MNHRPLIIAVSAACAIAGLAAMYAEHLYRATHRGQR